MSDGIFSQPGPDGIFGYGQGGKPLDASSPTIDSDDRDLRETLVAVFPSPGHMRVARATRNVKTGVVEKYEEYREPTERERTILAQQGVYPPPAAPVPGPVSYPPAPTGLVAPQLGTTDGNGKKEEGWPWFKLVVAAGLGVAACLATQKYVMPMMAGGGGERMNPRADDDDGDDGDDADDDKGDEG